MSDEADQLTNVIADLLREGRQGLADLLNNASFRRLVDVCVELFPEETGTTGAAGRPDTAGASWALANALRGAGVPGSAELPQARQVSNLIVDAMRQTELQLIHLCPLDQADEWPNVQFGPCEIRRFKGEDFAELLDLPRLRYHYPNLPVAAESFSQFSWLLVRERGLLSRPIGSRALPFLYQRFDQAFGAIDPYRRRRPDIVERALFALVLLPWESMTEYREFEWRGFRAPWVYTVNPDPFAKPALPPRADSLSWEPDIFQDTFTGEVIEAERPIVLSLVPTAPRYFAALTTERWTKIETALSANLFNPLVAHFVLHAFASEGIDEFISHVIAIEAALGMARDHDRRSRPKVGGRDVGATMRVAKRIATLTGANQSYDDFIRLFKLRSDFVHGKKVTSIPASERMAARMLAREVANDVVNAAAADPSVSREQFLENLSP
jgi:hypothetical protein